MNKYEWSQALKQTAGPRLYTATEARELVATLPGLCNSTVGRRLRWIDNMVGAYGPDTLFISKPDGLHLYSGDGDE